METLGNISLLNRHCIGFLAGSKISPMSVLPTLDWASAVAARDNLSILSGFHSRLEQETLRFLLRGSCGIICVLARSLYSYIPAEFKMAFESGRVLFVTEERQRRATKDSAIRRNKLIVALSSELVTPSVAPESSLAEIVSTTTKKMTTL